MELSVLYHRAGFSGERAVRLAASAGAGLLVAALVFVAHRHPMTQPDFWQPWFGATAALAGLDPYQLVGPGREYPHEFRFLYPLTASVAVLPFSFLPFQFAIALFTGGSAALLAFALTRDGHYYPLMTFLSVPFVSAAWAGQWSILLSAAFLLPWLAWGWVCKPTIGLAMLAARCRRQDLHIAAIGALILVSVGTLLVPKWPGEWVENIWANTGHMTAPVMRPLGFVALAALLRWRRPEARLVALLSLVPQTPLWYEAVPLFLVPRSFREFLVLLLSTSLPMFYEVMFGGGDGSYDVWPLGAQLALFGHLPAVVMVLARPNRDERAA